MKLLGWCIKCRKVRQVNVRRPTTAKVQVGVCDQCAAKGK